MRKPIPDRYGSRLMAAMEQKDCNPKELAKVCGCSIAHVRNIADENNDTPLGTLYHFRAAFHLQQDPLRLLTGNALPIRPELEGPITHFTLDYYEQGNAARRNAVHELLSDALAQLPDPGK